MSSPTSSEPRPAPTGAPQAAAVPERGELGPVSALRLYYLAASSQATGRLAFELADRGVEVHFRKGQPDFVDSSHPEDTLGAYLVRERLLTAEQLAQAEAARGGFGGELLGALFGLGLVPPAQAFTVLTQRAHELLGRALFAETGRFHFGPSSLPPSRALPLGDRWGLLSALMRRMPGPELRRRLTPVLSLPVMKSGGRVDPSELRLTPQEVRTLGRIDGVRSLAQLLQEAPQETDNLLRLAFLLREVEALSFVTAPSRPAPPPPGARPASAPPPPAQPARPPPAPGHAAAPGTVPARPPPPVLTSSGPVPTSRPAAAPAAGAPAAAGAPPVLVPGAPPSRAPAPGAAAVPPGVRAPPVLSATQPPLPPRPAPAAPDAPPQRSLASPSAPGRPAPVPGAPAAARPPAPAPRPAAAPAATPAPATADLAAELVPLRALLEKLKGQDHFERLGVPQTADTGAVKAAYFKLARLYHPDTVAPGAPPEMGKLKEDIFAAIGEAYRTLGDDAGRANYLQELKTGGGEVDVLHILKAEELFNKACILVRARRFAEALKLLDDAIALHADEGEFYAWRGYARFFLREDRQAGRADALRELQEALKRNERCVPAHFFMGQVAKLTGDAAGALKHFKRTLELKPDHIDAAREVRLMSGKK